MTTSVRPRYVVSALRYLPIHFKLTQKHYLRNLYLKFEFGQNSKTIVRMAAIFKISKCYNFNENLYIEDFRSEECDSDKCDMKMAAFAAIMVSILAAIFYMVANNFEVLQLPRQLIFRGF